jgi:hypothetical protein
MSKVECQISENREQKKRAENREKVKKLIEISESSQRQGEEKIEKRK